MKYQGEFIEQINEIKELAKDDSKNIINHCNELMILSKLAGDNYAYAFGQTMLFDTYYLNRDVEKCREIANKTITMNKLYNYNDLLINSYNTLALFSLMLQDFPKALSALLNGIQILSPNDYYDQIRFNNNISLCFEAVNDIETAYKFLNISYKIYQEHKDEIDTPDIIIFIVCNLIDLLIQDNELEQATMYYNKLISYKKEIKPSFKVLVDARIAQYYEMSNQLDKVKLMIDNCLANYKSLEHFFAYRTAIVEYTKIAIRQELKEESRSLLKILEELCMAEDIESKLKYQKLEIFFEETFYPDCIIKNCYYEYYELQKKMINSANKSKAEGMRDRLKNFKLMEENNILKEQNKIDPLTNIYNRNYFNIISNKIYKDNSINTIGTLMIDIDYFKEYNDTYGHIAGDKIISTIALLLKKYSNDSIIPCRYGGDEFICLLIDIDNKVVEQYLDNIYKDLKALNIEHRKSKAAKYVSITCGYSIVENNTISIPELIKLSDLALYEIKQNGRNGYKGNKNI